MGKKNPTALAIENQQPSSNLMASLPVIPFDLPSVSDHN